MKTYAVLGYTQSGKSTVGHMIAEATGGKAASISDYLAKYLAAFLDNSGMIFHPPDWCVPKTTVTTMKNHPILGPYIRHHLYELGHLAEDQDPLCIINQMLTDGVNIICGMRTWEAIWGAIMNRTFDEYWWIARSDCTRGQTDGLLQGTTERFLRKLEKIRYHIIDNNGTLEDLEYKVLDALGKESK